MSKSDQRIIVVKRELLFGQDYFEGFRIGEEVDYESRIATGYKVMRRGSTEEPENHPEGNAELNTQFKQPIGYSILINPKLKRVFAYHRSSVDLEYAERRLQGKWSWGFGGHIELSDAGNRNFIRQSALRELKEEVRINGLIEKVDVLGYLNYDSDFIGKVHFGILYLFSTNSDEVMPLDSEISKVVFCSLGELEKLCSSQDVKVEEWSKLSLEPLRKIL